MGKSKGRPITTFTNTSFAEEMLGGGEMPVPPAKKLEDLIRLAELCVDLLRQNEEFYAEVRKQVVSLQCAYVYINTKYTFFALTFKDYDIQMATWME